jgi:hypothetical protein
LLIPPATNLRNQEVDGSNTFAFPRHLSRIFFAALGVPIITGRDFNDSDGQKGTEPVVIVSETRARRMFPNEDAVNRHVYWTVPY